MEVVVAVEGDGERVDAREAAVGRSPAIAIATAQLSSTTGSGSSAARWE